MYVRACVQIKSERESESESESERERKRKRERKENRKNTYASHYQAIPGAIQTLKLSPNDSADSLCSNEAFTGATLDVLVIQLVVEI